MGTAFINNASAEGGSSRNSTDAAIRWIGDLDHPFYQDERSRFVWYEASAVAFQLLFMGIYIMAGAMFWIGGAEALPYGGPFLLLAIASALVMNRVVSMNSAEYFPNKFDFSRSRGKVVLLAGVFLLSGGIRAFLDLGGNVGGNVGGDVDGGFFGGFGNGGAIGLGVGALVGVAALATRGRQHRRQEAAAALRED